LAQTDDTKNWSHFRSSTADLLICRVREVRVWLRYGEKEGAALAEFRFKPDPAVMPNNNPAAKGQADAIARIGLLSVQPTEKVKDPVVVFGINPDAVVADENRHSPFSLFAEMWICGKEAPWYLIPLSMRF
jgi:hypothetical protein